MDKVYFELIHKHWFLCLFKNMYAKNHTEFCLVFLSYSFDAKNMFKQCSYKIILIWTGWFRKCTLAWTIPPFSCPSPTAKYLKEHGKLKYLCAYNMQNINLQYGVVYHNLFNPVVISIIMLHIYHYVCK